MSGEVFFDQLGDGALELREALVHLDDLIGGDRVGGIDVGQVLGPFGTAPGTYTRACVVCPMGILATTLLLSVSMTVAASPFSNAT